MRMPVPMPMLTYCTLCTICVQIHGLVHIIILCITYSTICVQYTQCALCDGMSLYPFLSPDLRYTLVVMCMFLACSVLCPVLWYLWIHAGSANANFFFAITLTYALAQVRKKDMV